MQNQARNLVIVALVAALVAVTCWKQSQGQGEAAKPAAVNWEYKYLSVDVRNQDSTPLDKLGSDGWELCVAHPFSKEGDFLSYAFKRPKAAK